MKVAIYCRLSEEDRNKRCETDDSGSIANQKAMLAKYAADRSWEVYDIYSDDDYTGADRNRPQFKRLIEDARARHFEVILCKSQSRFTRELELVEKYIHGLFVLWGIRFIGLVDNADSENKGNKKSRQINGLVNEWYLEDMSDSIKSVLDNKRERGLHIGAFALYGYKKDPDSRGHLLIDEEAAEVVREVYELFARGYGKTAIARMLNARGIPNPTEYKRRLGLNYKQPECKSGTLWKYSAISKMLTNEIYIGNMVQGRYGSVSYKTKQNRPRPREEWFIVENTHEPIISRELWERVQSLLIERTKPCFDGKVGIFAGKVRCAGCGYILRSSVSRGRHYLSCPSRHISKEACEGAFISVERLEAVVCSELGRIAEEYLCYDRLYESIRLVDVKSELRKRFEGECTEYRRKAADCTKRISELYADKQRGIITERDFVSISGELAAERERIESLLYERSRSLSELVCASKGKDTRSELIARYAHPARLSRELIDGLIEYISVGRRIPGTRDVPVVINWRF